ncbi:MAG: DUF2683 family protein [Nanoarchaeota archaeon]
MVQAMVNISENANQILNIVKARYNLKDKSEAIERVVLDFGGNILEPGLRPEFAARLQRIKKENGIRFNSIEELKRHIENA